MFYKSQEKMIKTSTNNNYDYIQLIVLTLCSRCHRCISKTLKTKSNIREKYTYIQF